MLLLGVTGVLMIVAALALPAIEAVLEYMDK